MSTIKSTQGKTTIYKTHR